MRQILPAIDKVLPAIDKVLPFQVENLDLILCIIVRQHSFLLGFPPIHTPRYLKGNTIQTIQKYIKVHFCHPYHPNMTFVKIHS